MATKRYDPKQDLLFISTPHDALPEDHLRYFIDEVVEKLDFSSLPDRSKTPGHPESMIRGLKSRCFFMVMPRAFSLPEN